MRPLLDPGTELLVRWEAELGDLHGLCQGLVSASKGHQVGSGCNLLGYTLLMSEP